MSDYATFDTQFGTLTRPTHRNTTWDAAKWVCTPIALTLSRFEVCAHKFADLSEVRVPHDAD